MYEREVVTLILALLMLVFCIVPMGSLFVHSNRAQSNVIDLAEERRKRRLA